MSAIQLNIKIEQGIDYNLVLELTDEAGDPLDTTNYQALGSIKKWYTSNNVTTFDISINNGILQATLPSVKSSLLNQDRYVYDIILIDETNITIRLVEGLAVVTPAVTFKSSNTQSNTVSNTIVTVSTPITVFYTLGFVGR